MPLIVETKWHHVNDAKITPMLTDPRGGSATYDDAIDVPGIRTVGVTSTVNTQSLRGDNQLLDSETQLVALGLTFEHGILSLDALAAMTGEAVVQSGTTPNQKASLPIYGDLRLPYWRFEAQSDGVDFVLSGGDGHLVFYKCIISGFPNIGFANEDYASFTGGANCMPRLSDKLWIAPEFNETAVPIAA